MLQGALCSSAGARAAPIELCNLTVGHWPAPESTSCLLTTPPVPTPFCGLQPFVQQDKVYLLTVPCLW